MPLVLFAPNKVVLTRPSRVPRLVGMELIFDMFDEVRPKPVPSRVVRPPRPNESNIDPCVLWLIFIWSNTFAPTQCAIPARMFSSSMHLNVRVIEPLPSLSLSRCLWLISKHIREHKCLAFIWSDRGLNVFLLVVATCNNQNLSFFEDVIQANPRCSRIK